MIKFSLGDDRNVLMSSTKGSQTERRALFSRKVPCSFLYSPLVTTSKSKGFLKIGLSWPLLQVELWYRELRYSQFDKVCHKCYTMSRGGDGYAGKKSKDQCGF